MKNKTGNLVQLLRRYNIIIILLLIFILAYIISPEFRTISNIKNLLNHIAIIGILAVGQTVVLITGNFDLSHGSYIALSSVLLALLMPHGILIAILGATLMLVFLGMFNAFFVNRGVVSLIVTLGMMGIARSLAMFFSNTFAVPIDNDDFRRISFGDYVFGLPNSVIVWILLVLLLSYILKHTRTGKHIYATGGDKESARLSGVNIKKTTHIAYIISALCAVVAGVFYASRLGVGLPDSAVGYEMISIAAAVIGGASLFGGIGTQWGTLVGALVFGIITNFLSLMGVSPFWQQVFSSLILGIAVYLNLRGTANKKGERSYG